MSEVSKTKKEKAKKKKLWYIFTMAFLCTIFVGCLIYLGIYYIGTYINEKKVDNLKDLIITEEEDPSTTIDTNIASDTDVTETIDYVNIEGVLVQRKFEEIYKKNNDFIGWITIEDTNIDYPVVQSMYDEEYYIHRDFDKKSNSNGTIFADTSSDIRRPSDNILLYGHHMKTGKMFQNLLKYEDEEFYKEHKYITFDTIAFDGTYEVIAAFRTQIYDKDYTGFKYYDFFDASNRVEFDSFVSNCKELTPYTINTTAEYGDQLLTLSTCAYHVTNGRYVVVAKKIK